MKRVMALTIMLPVAAYVLDRILYRWYANWGTPGADRDRALPGDHLTPEATSVTTRTVDIDAPQNIVWSWLVQIGQDRAGFYSYRWLENLALAEMPKVERIVPEWQSRSQGEVVWLGTPRHWHGNAKQYIADIEPQNHYIMTGEADWQSIQSGGFARGTWGFIVEPAGPGRSRLVARSRYTTPPPGFELAHFIMERKVLLRMKELAEGVAAGSLQPFAPAN
jgi:hypothetical protein